VPSREALLRHPLAIAGALITTASAVVFIALVIAELVGLLDNPYSGLVVFIAVPAAFVLGLLLIPAGMWLQRRKLLREPGAATGWPILDFGRPSVRRGALIVTALTAVNIVILLLAGYGSLHSMESPSFCGEVCHAPMHPQFTAWGDGPHARIACVRCHVSEGAAGFVHAKLNGVRQLVEVSTNSYPRPIPPGAHMPPGKQAETCGNCHQPGRIAGDQIRVLREFADDEKNTETTTILQMHVGSASPAGRSIHWHANPSIRIEYVSTDAGHQTIPYVKVTNAQGQVKEYRTTDATDQVVAAGSRKIMDCLDCHNSVGHPISPTPEKAVDEAIALGQVSRDLPFVRREAVRLVKASYPSQEAALAEIDRGLRTFYQSQASADQQAVGRSITGVQDVFRRNVFPAMNVTWGSYPNNKGHMTSNGCFRCHDGSHTAADGTSINADCEYCHKQIEKP